MAVYLSNVTFLLIATFLISSPFSHKSVLIKQVNAYAFLSDTSNNSAYGRTGDRSRVSRTSSSPPRSQWISSRRTNRATKNTSTQGNIFMTNVDEEIVADIKTSDESAEESTDETEIKTCFYKAHDGKWRPRIQLNELKVGQKLIGTKIPGADLLDGRTGAKLFFECGIGRIDAKGNWQMASGMLRIGRKSMKASVVKKKVKKVSGKNKVVELYVSRIRPDHGTLEVCTNIENVDLEQSPMRSASSLKVGEELVGKVVNVRSFGCLVDVGANRKGLLHIQKVADLFGKYIDKEKGLKDAGLERGATIKVSVLSNEKKRLFLDFTKDVLEEAKQEREAAEAAKLAKIEEEKEEKSEVTEVSADASDEEDSKTDEAADWAAAAYADYADYADYSEDDYDDDDEDRGIEDALGIGSY